MLPVPEGWKRQITQRQSGASAGKYDIYYYSPDGKKLRSKNDILSHCDKVGIEVDIDLFQFSHASVVNGEAALKARKKSVSSTPTTPKIQNLTTPKAAKKVKSAKSETKADSNKKSIKISKNLTKKSAGSAASTNRIRKSIWVPPKSPYNLFQESYFQNPWKLLIGTILYSRMEDQDLTGFLSKFFKKWGSPESLEQAATEEITELLSTVQVPEEVTEILVQFSKEYNTKPWVYPKELHGIGKFGNDSYRTFCVNEWRKVKPIEFLLNFYIGWLWDNESVLGLS